MKENIRVPYYMYWSLCALIEGAYLAVIPLYKVDLAIMPAAGFSSPTNVDIHKCRHIEMSPHLSGYIHPQSHNSLVKNRIYDN